ncbi:MAG TPA: phosphohistidine phosphatase SixA [Gaiellaceae bacterium]|jgi:phosphohistidine phosphatase SixA|nr:phosphohistidine phosphatase SixA [Gaiellaceae bacterium]
MRIYLVRHAEAAPGQPDELRRLTAEGRAAARALGERLREETEVDAVLTSPLLRARETADEIARALGRTAESTELLAPGASGADLLEAVEGLGEVVVAVGHQPDCSLIATALAGGEPPAFPPGGVVRLEL